MTTEDQNKVAEEEFEVVELPEGSEAPPTTVAEKKVPEEDDRLRQSDEDDEEDETSGAEGETAEQAAERKREARRRRRERQKRAERENKEQIRFLAEQNQELLSRLSRIEGRTLKKEAEDVDNRMRIAASRYKRAEQAIAEAAANNEGELLAAAMRARDAAANEFHQAKSIRERISQFTEGRQQQPERQQRPAGPDPRMVEKARAFAEKHPWLDPTGTKDDDSAVVQGLDIALTKRGLDPTTDEYWEELDKAMRAKLPHRFAKASEGRKGPPVAGGPDRAASGKKQFFLSAERKAALIASGDWDDPVRRQHMLRKYAEHDAKNGKQ